VLYDDPAGAPKRLGALEAAIDRKAAALLDEARAAYALQAERLKTQPIYDPPQTADEKDAANLIVTCASGEPSFSGCAATGGRGGGGGRGAGSGRGSGATGPTLPQHMNAELTILLGKKMTVLQIRDFLSGEFEPVPLADVMAALRAREAAGTVKLVPKPAAEKSK
jgi:hypothetical protein